MTESICYIFEKCFNFYAYKKVKKKKYYDLSTDRHIIYLKIFIFKSGNSNIASLKKLNRYVRVIVDRPLRSNDTL